jgi:hypothetical protein
MKMPKTIKHKPEYSVQVFADSVEADVVEEGALVDVDTTLGVRGVRMHVTHLAFAGEGTLDILSQFVDEDFKLI